MKVQPTRVFILNVGDQQYPQDDLAKVIADFRAKVRSLDIANVVCECTIMNDEDADGHDISWIWDVDYEKLACDPFLHKIYVWGKRAEDLQLRLKYAGIPENGIKRVKEKKALLEAIGNSRVPVYILPNYTTMLSLWKTLKKQAVPH